MILHDITIFTKKNGFDIDIFDVTQPSPQTADTRLGKLLEVDDAVAVDIGFVPETIQAVAGQIRLTSGRLQYFRRKDAIVCADAVICIYTGWFTVSYVSSSAIPMDHIIGHY